MNIGTQGTKDTIGIPCTKLSYTSTNQSTNSSARRNYPKHPTYSTNSIGKLMVFGSILLVSSAFILIRSHSITALILGVIGIAVLIAGAAQQSTLSPTNDTPTLGIGLCKNCNSKCETAWTYCTQCGSTLTNQSVRLCSHCGMKIETDWKFCAHCTKEI